MEAAYGYGTDPLEALVLIYEDAGRRWPEPEQLLALNEEREMAMIMTEGYWEWVAATGKDAALQVIATERDIRVPLDGLDADLRARLDQVVYDGESGLAGFLDHKTAANFDKHEHMDLDSQFPTYGVVQAIARPAGAPQVYGGWINTLRRVKRTARSRPPYYRRDHFPCTPEKLTAELRHIRGTVIEILGARRGFDAIMARGNVLQEVDAAQQVVTYPNRISRLCSWDCPYEQVCPMMDDGSDWTGALVRSGRWVQGDPYSYYSDSLLPLILTRYCQGRRR